MKKFSILILMLSTLACADKIYTVDELILKAVKNSPNLKISLAQLEASKSRIDIANSSYLPLVNLHLSAGENAQDNVNDTLILGNLSLKQIIYDFGKTDANIDSFTHDSKSYEMINEQEISDKKRDVKFTYYNVLKALALIKVHQENIKLNESQLYRSQKYFEAGIKTKIDISDAEVELIKSKLDLKKAQYDLQLAYASLDRVICFKDTDEKYSVYYEKLDFKNLYSSLSDYVLNLKDSIDYAYENRYMLKKYISDIEIAKSKSNLAYSGYYPEIYLDADYTQQRANKFKDSIPEKKWQASLNLNFNIYQGGSTLASTQEKRVQIDIAHAELQNAKLSIKKETTEAYINVYKAKDTVELSQSLVRVSNEKFDQASKRYEHGLSDYIELQQSRQGYIDSLSSLVVNYYHYYQAVAYLDNAIGK